MGTHPIFESDFDCLTVHPKIFIRMENATMLMAMGTTMSSKSQSVELSMNQLGWWSTSLISKKPSGKFSSKSTTKMSTSKSIGSEKNHRQLKTSQSGLLKSFKKLLRKFEKIMKTGS